MWAIRNIAGRRYEQWWTGPDTFDNRRRKARMEWRRSMRWMVPAGAVIALGMLALIVWTVWRFTS